MVFARPLQAGGMERVKMQKLRGQSRSQRFGLTRRGRARQIGDRGQDGPGRGQRRSR